VKAVTSLEAGMKSTIDWFRANQSA
jgi:hypothetical protein